MVVYERFSGEIYHVKVREGGILHRCREVAWFDHQSPSTPEAPSILEPAVTSFTPRGSGRHR